MQTEAYELAAQAARYIFAALMLLIVLRAARGLAQDTRRAAKLRRLSPMTGLSGELVVLEGTARVQRQRRYAVIREGTIGSSRYADVRLRTRSVRRRHLFFVLTEDGLSVRGHAGTTLRFNGKTCRKALLRDGDEFEVGSIRLLLVLTDARGGSTERENADDIFYARNDEELYQEPFARRGEETPEEEITFPFDPDAAYRRPTHRVPEDDARLRRPTAQRDMTGTIYRRTSEFAAEDDARLRRTTTQRDVTGTIYRRTSEFAAEDDARLRRTTVQRQAPDVPDNLFMDDDEDF